MKPGRGRPGYKHTEEAKQNMRDAKKRIKKTKPVTAAENPETYRERASRLIREILASRDEIAMPDKREEDRANEKTKQDNRE